MQIVIDIPEELKNKCDELEFEKAINYVRWFDGTLTNAIKNGTPLEDIKAEIEETKEKMFCTDDEKQGLDVALAIIDKHTNT